MWPFWRRKPLAADVPVHRAGPGDWRALAPMATVQRSPMSTLDAGFEERLATRRAPLFLAPLGHHLVPGAPAGRVAAAVVPSSGRQFAAAPHIRHQVASLAPDPGVADTISPLDAEVPSSAPDATAPLAAAWRPTTTATGPVVSRSSLVQAVEPDLPTVVAPAVVRDVGLVGSERIAQRPPVDDVPAPVADGRPAQAAAPEPAGAVSPDKSMAWASSSRPAMVQPALRDGTTAADPPIDSPVDVPAAPEPRHAATARTTAIEQSSATPDDPDVSVVAESATESAPVQRAEPRLADEAPTVDPVDPTPLTTPVLGHPLRTVLGPPIAPASGAGRPPSAPHPDRQEPAARPLQRATTAPPVTPRPEHPRMPGEAHRSATAPEASAPTSSAAPLAIGTPHEPSVERGGQVEQRPTIAGQWLPTLGRQTLDADVPAAPGQPSPRLPGGQRRPDDVASRTTIEPSTGGDVAPFTRGSTAYVEPHSPDQPGRPPDTAPSIPLTSVAPVRRSLIGPPLAASPVQRTALPFRPSLRAADSSMVAAATPTARPSGDDAESLETMAALAGLPVQRQSIEPAAAPVSEGGFETTTLSAAATTGPAAAGASPSVARSEAEVEELFRALYPSLRRRLCRDLLLDRERAGYSTDIRF